MVSSYRQLSPAKRKIKRQLTQHRMTYRHGNMPAYLPTARNNVSYRWRGNGISAFVSLMAAGNWMALQ